MSPVCPLCGELVSPLASYCVVESLSTGERYQAHPDCTKSIPDPQN